MSKAIPFSYGKTSGLLILCKQHDHIFSPLQRMAQSLCRQHLKLQILLNYLSEEAMVQLNLFQTMLQNLLPGDVYDSWSIYGSSKSYKVPQIYKNMMKNNGVIPDLKWMWEGCCQQKHKVFFWLLTNNRLNTRAMLQRKNFFLDGYSYVMCGSQLETRDHLFFQYPFATLCWQYLCPTWSLQPRTHLNFQETILSLKTAIAKPFFMEIIMLITWKIWITKNDFIFKSISPSINRCHKKFKDEMALIIYKAKRKSYKGSWVEQFR
jgi:hypothetical protein